MKRQARSVKFFFNKDIKDLRDKTFSSEAKKKF